jgi:hypothetical protein
VPTVATAEHLNGQANLSGIVKQLKKERDRVENQLSGLDAALRAFANVYSGAKPGRKRKKMSVAARKEIAAAQRARWAKVRGKGKAAPKRTMSASSRRKIAAAQRRRWAKFRAKRKR